MASAIVRSPLTSCQCSRLPVCPSTQLPKRHGAWPPPAGKGHRRTCAGPDVTGLDGQRDELVAMKQDDQPGAIAALKPDASGVRRRCRPSSSRAPPLVRRSLAGSGQRRRRPDANGRRGCTQGEQSYGAARRPQSNRRAMNQGCRFSLLAKPKCQNCQKCHVGYSASGQRW
jgi:hypothetical protein